MEVCIKKCRDCGAENSNEARFCNKCGSEFKVRKDKVKQSSTVAGIDSYYIIAAVFIAALIIILVIFNSNNTHLQKKQQAASQNNSAQTASSSQPSMEMMQQIQALKDAVKANPRDFAANVNLGNAYFDIGRFDRAVSYYKTANSIQGGQTSVLIDMGVSYFNLNKPDSSLLFINQALAISPDHIYGLYNSGIIYYNLNRVDEALAAWKKLISKHPNSREAQSAKEFIQKIEQEKINS